MVSIALQENALQFGKEKTYTGLCMAMYWLGQEKNQSILLVYLLFFST